MMTLPGRIPRRAGSKTRLLIVRATGILNKAGAPSSLRNIFAADTDPTLSPVF